MPYLLIHHNIADYDRFRAVFDDDAERRRRLGSQGGRLLRSTAGPNDFFALFEWDDVENARKFVASYETHEAFEWALPAEEIRAFVLEDVDTVES
jgi:hypothetical protein